MKLKKFIKSTCTLAVMLLIVGMYISPSVAKVRENGCSYARVKGIGYSVDGEYGTVFSGYWNPDIY